MPASVRSSIILKCSAHTPERLLFGGEMLPLSPTTAYTSYARLPSPVSPELSLGSSFSRASRLYIFGTT